MNKRLFNGLLLFAALMTGLAPLAADAVPPIQEARLDNGMRILLIEAHNVPMVSMSLVVPAGSRFDADSRDGTAALLAAMLTDHTARHDNEAWAEHLDAEAIMLSAGVDRDGMYFNLTVIKEAVPEGLEALAEALLKPGWDKKRFAILKEDSIDSLKKAMERPGVRASQAVIHALYGKHPYGHRSVGSIESLRRVKIRDLRHIYASQVRPAGAVLAVSGDITMPELLKLIKPLLSGWQGKPEKGVFDLQAPAERKGQHKNLHMDTQQAHLTFVRLGPERKNSDFYATYVANHMLGGGGFGSLLMEEVREKRGLVYGVYSHFIPLAVAGPYIIKLQTRADRADHAAKVVRQVLRDMYEKGVDGKRLAKAKAHLIGGFAQRLNSNRKRVGWISTIGFYDLPLDYMQRWTANVRAVTLDDVRRAARRYLNPDDWSLVRIGP